MNPKQQRAFEAIQARLRHGLGVDLALEQCKDHGIPVAGVVRHHLGWPGDPRYNTAEDVSAEYGVSPPAMPLHEGVRA